MGRAAFCHGPATAMVGGVVEGTKGWLPKNPKPCAVLVLSAGEHKGLAGLAAHQPAGALTFALGACPWGIILGDPLGGSPGLSPRVCSGVS